MMKRTLRSLFVVALLSPAVLAEPKDIVDTAVGAKTFKTLVAAVQAADLVDVLKSDGPFTVFAPTDEAFAKLPKSAISDLLKPENKTKLQEILKYHVVPGRVLAGDVLKVAEAATVQGGKVKFSLSIEGAKIVATDIECSNGVIHVIDSVLMPSKPEKKVSQLSPRRMIADTIAKGSRLYNSGHPGQCSELYSKTMTRLTSHETAGVPCGVRDKLTHVMSHAAGTSDADQRAWILRRGLDLAYHSVTH